MHQHEFSSGQGLMTDDEADDLYAPGPWQYSAAPVAAPPPMGPRHLWTVYEGNSEPTNSVPGSNRGSSNDSSQAGRSERASIHSRHSRGSTDPGPGSPLIRTGPRVNERIAFFETKDRTASPSLHSRSGSMPSIPSPVSQSQTMPSMSRLTSHGPASYGYTKSPTFASLSETSGSEKSLPTIPSIKSQDSNGQLLVYAYPDIYPDIIL